MNLTYHEAIAKAEALKQLGETNIYLHINRSFDLDVPWHQVTGVTAGNVIRLGMDVSVQFHARDPATGLEFHWWCDIERSDANGKGSFEIDIGKLRTILSKLSDAGRVAFADHLRSSAAKVRKQGDEYRSVAERQYAYADALESIDQGRQH